MNSTRISVVLLVLGLLATPPARAEDARPAIKIGGDFQIETKEDIAYYEGKDADPVKHKLDLYLPRGQKDFPVLFFVHGGSWRSGDRKMYTALGNVFAKNGIGTVIISYRLSPAVQHPGHVQDVARAFAWTHANIAKHGGRPDQVFASGHSAGGHLVALLATDESYLKAEKCSFADLKAVIPISGVYVIVPNRIFEPAFGKDETVVKNAAPINHVREHLVPFCMIYAEKDYPTLDAMAEQMCRALQKCKCEASAMCMKERDHISIIRQAASSEADPTTQAMLVFIAKHSGLKLTARETK